MVLTITRAWNKYISPDMRHGRAAALMIDGDHRRLGGVAGLKHGMGVGPAGGSTCSLSTHLREKSTDMSDTEKKGTLPTLDKQRQGKGGFNSLPGLDIETSVEL